MGDTEENPSGTSMNTQDKNPNNTSNNNQYNSSLVRGAWGEIGNTRNNTRINTANMEIISTIQKD